jgi:tRNA(adenine34) deaminase
MTISYALYSEEYFMNEALKEARKALEKDEVPVGAVVVSENMIIARAHNLTETLNDVTAHAEMQSITAASSWLGGKYLSDCTIYITLEPCVMCAGAIFWSQMGAVVYGADDDKRGYTLTGQPLMHPKTQVRKGVLAEECAQLLTEFFHKKR